MNPAERAAEFVDLFSQSARRIYSYIRTLIPNQADGEDVFQETSKVLWEKFSDFQSGTDFCAWALSIAHYKALQARRAHGKSQLILSDELERLLEGAAIESRDSADARFHALAECVEKLPATDRVLVDARYSLGATTKAVADAQRRSTDAIYRSLRRIHKSLFDCIRKSLDEEAAS